MGKLRFRFLLPEEHPRIEAVCQEHDWPIPHPSVGQIRVAENKQNEIVAFICSDAVPHLGPGWIHPDHRTNPRIWEDAFNSMMEKINQEGVFPGVIMIAETEASEKIAQRLGMKKSKGVLYVKER